MLFDIDDFRDTGHRLLLDDAEAGGEARRLALTWLPGSVKR